MDAQSTWVPSHRIQMTPHKPLTLTWTMTSALESRATPPSSASATKASVHARAGLILRRPRAPASRSTTPNPEAIRDKVVLRAPALTISTALVNATPIGATHGGRHVHAQAADAARKSEADSPVPRQPPEQCPKPNGRQRSQQSERQKVDPQRREPAVGEEDRLEQEHEERGPDDAADADHQGEHRRKADVTRCAHDGDR